MSTRPKNVLHVLPNYKILIKPCKSCVHYRVHVSTMLPGQGVTETRSKIIDIEHVRKILEVI